MAKSTDSFSFECPRCQTMVTLGAGRAGQKVSCPNCNAEMIVPGSKPRAESDFDDLFELEPETPLPPEAKISLSGELAIDAVDVASDEDLALDSRAGESESSGIEIKPDDEPIANVEVIDDLLADVAPEPAPLQVGEDPLKLDENLPIPIDDVPRPQPDQLYLKCPVCDSVMAATKSQVGQKIRCSDCHSQIEVIAPATPAKRGPKPLDQAVSREPAETLSAFPELPNEGSAQVAELADEYGLEPASEDMLRPRAEALPPELLDLVQKAYPTAAGVASVPQAPVVPSTVAPQRAAPAGGPALPTVAQPSVPKPGEKIASTAGSNLLPEVEVPPPPMKELSVNEQFKWPEQFLCVFKDFGVLQMAALIALFTIVCASIGSYGLYLMQFEENNARPYVVFGIPVMIMAGAIGFGTSLFAAVMVNQLIEGAAYKRSVFHPPELGALELLNSLLPVAVSFWAGMLPGIVFGQIIGAVFHRWWVSFVVAFATAFFLAPIGILSAYYNGSPFQIYSSEVVQTVRTKTSGWMRFYSWLGLWVFLYCVSAAFNFLPGGLLGIVLSAVAQTVFVVLIGRTIGLLAQSFINFWIDQDA